MKVYNDKFYAYLEDLNVSYGKLAHLLVEKAEAVEKDDLLRLQEIINDEQVYVLKARGFDQNLANFRTQSGYVGEKFSDIIQELPESERPRFTALHATLTDALEEVRILNDKCQKLIQIKMHGINKIKREIDRASAPPPSKDKKPPAATGGKLSKSI